MARTQVVELSFSSITNIAMVDVQVQIYNNEKCLSHNFYVQNFYFMFQLWFNYMEEFFQIRNETSVKGIIELSFPVFKVSVSFVIDSFID